MSKQQPTGIEQRNGRFRAQVYDAQARKTIKRTFDTLSAAKRWRTDAAAALRAGDLSAERGPRLRDAVEVWFAAMQSGQAANRSGDVFKPSAVRGYQQSMRLRVLPALGDLRIADITTRDVQLFVDGLVAQGLAPATVDASLTSLRAYYRRAASRGDVKANPCLRIEKPGARRKDVRVVPAASVAAMLDALDPADRALWAVAFYAGLRRGELIALRWSNVNLADGYLAVEAGWDDQAGEISPKSRQGRRKIPIAAVLRDHLDQHQASTGDHVRLFKSQRWVQGSNDRARKAWTALGLPVLTLHEGRHVCASMMIAANINLKAISTYLGHGNIGVTLDYYGHLLPGSATEAVGLFDAYLAREIGGTTVPATVPDPTILAL